VPQGIKLDLSLSQPPSFDGLGSVSKLSLPDQVFATLRDALMCGRFAPGQRIPLRTIAAALGTSTMPAREAVNRLVTMGALELLPNRRVSVPASSANRYQEIMSARIIVEPAAAEAASTLISDAEIEELAAMHLEMQTWFDQLEKPGAGLRYMELEKSFFFKIYAATRSSILMSVIQSFWLMTGPFLNIVITDSREWFTTDPIKPIVDALRARNPAETKAAVHYNLENALNFILKNGKLDRLLVLDES